MHAPTFNSRADVRADWLNLALWTLQGWIALFFIAAAYAKLTLDTEALTDLLGWTATISPSAVRGIGAAELVLAFGMLAPLIAGRLGRPVLIGVAGALLGLEAVMLIVHAMAGDIGHAIVNVLLIAITAPVVWFRSR